MGRGGMRGKGGGGREERLVTVAVAMGRVARYY